MLVVGSNAVVTPVAWKGTHVVLPGVSLLVSPVGFPVVHHVAQQAMCAAGLHLFLPLILIMPCA